MTEILTSRSLQYGPDLTLLRDLLDGDVFAPGDDGWDEARRAWNLSVDQRPAAVALPESAEDVVTIVAFAAANDLRVAPQGTGHGAAALDGLHDTILLKTERMRGVTIDPEARTARVEAGVIWIEVVEAAAEHGLVALAGSSPDVGVVGYTLGGGLSWLARKHGIGANQVTAVEVVTASGDVVRTDWANEPDLFWALRGGGGAFAIVTAIEFNLFPLEEVYAGHPVVPGRSRGGGAEGLARLDRRPAGRDDLGRSDPAVPADPGDPGAGAWTVVRRGRGDLVR